MGKGQKYGETCVLALVFGTKVFSLKTKQDQTYEET